MSSNAKTLRIPTRHPGEAEDTMPDPVENLILDLILWVGRRERSYQETMDAWRTTCPRLPVWEDATDRGLVQTASANGRSIVLATAVGLALLKEKRPDAFEELGRGRDASWPWLGAPPPG